MSNERERRNKPALLLGLMVLFVVSACSVSPDVGSEQTMNSGTISQEAVAGSPVAKYGRLKVVGNKVCAADGSAVQLRGMSLFWSQWSGQFYNTSVVNNQADGWKASIIRAAMGVESGGYLSDPNGQKNMVKTIVNAAIAKGIYVIIDWHDHNAVDHTAQARAFFKEMAQTYGSQPNVIFEVYNEPTSQSWGSVKAYAEAVIGEIRAAGSQNLVVVGSPTWSQDVDKAAADPITKYGNVAYTLHFYAGTHKQGLRDKAIGAINKGIALFVTEWGTCDASGNGNLDLNESQAWVNFMNQYKLSSCNWSLFDKQETASALNPGASTTGPWPDSQLTASGKFVKNYIGGNNNWGGGGDGGGSSSSAPSGGPAGYTKCANENQSYTFNQKVDVAYGANGKFYYKYGVTGTITFNNATFGDPISGVVKAGYYKVVNSGGGSTGSVTLNSWQCNANSGGLTLWTGGVGGWDAGEWIQFNNINLGAGFKYMDFSYATAVSGSFDVRINSVTGTTVGTFSYGSSGGWDTYKTVTINLNAALAKGVHNLFIRANSGAANLGVLKIHN